MKPPPVLNMGCSVASSTRPRVVGLLDFASSLLFLLCVFDWLNKLRFRPFIPLKGQCHHLVYKSADSVSLPRSCSGTIYLLSVPTALIALQV